MWLVGVIIRRYIDILIIIINFPYSTCIRSFFGSSILTSLFILMFFRSCFRYFLQCIANVTYRTFEIVQKNRDPTKKIFLIISVIKSVDGACARASPETSTCEVRNQVRMTLD